MEIWDFAAYVVDYEDSENISFLSTQPKIDKRWKGKNNLSMEIPTRIYEFQIVSLAPLVE